MNKQQPYSIPRLCDRKKDLSKSWYVYFTYKNELTGEKPQFRYKHELNTYKTVREREVEASGMISELINRLRSGWNPITDVVEESQPDVTISQAFDNLLDIKKSSITPRSYKTYYDSIGLFKKWLVIAKYDKLFVKNFTNLHARKYFDWLLQVKKYGGKTHNGHLGNVKVFFNGLVERETILKNPAAGIKKVPEDVGKNTTYSKEEELKLEKYMLENEKDFYYTTRFIRFLFFRRTELIKLQVKHINWDNKTIIVPSGSAKSRIQDSVTISKTLEKIIEEMQLLKCDPNMFVFGKHFVPSLKKLNRADDFSDKQRAINKLQDVKDECTFYSWKHTGVVELYNLTKDPYSVMRQCRHSDIQMTMIYLRSLGCGVNEDVRGW